MAFEAEELMLQAERIRHQRHTPAVGKAYGALMAALDARGVAFGSAGWRDAVKLFDDEHGWEAANDEIGHLYCKQRSWCSSIISISLLVTRFGLYRVGLG
jgi:hypothetical protein